MQVVKFKPYRNKLRNVFFGYAMTLVIILAAICFFLIFVMGYITVEKRNQYNNEKVNDSLEINLTTYRNIILEYSESDIILDSIHSVENRHKAYEIIYSFVNKQNIKCNFYFFNSNGEMVMSNILKPPDYIVESSKSNWGIFNRMRFNPDEVSVSTNRSYSPLNKYSIFTLGKAIKRSDNIMGYIIFELLETDVFSIISNSTGNDTVITDRYFSVAAATNNNYTDNLTKLKTEFRGTSGRIKVNGESYYLYRTDVLMGNFYVYTFTPLTYYQNTFLLSGIFLAGLFVTITIVMILWSKGISSKKTAVIYELLDAIKSVQNGNLDTVLKIDSNDEFEIIADSYNKMLVDIKNLIKQNNEETKRSLMAEIKQLESQFDPHFLFNTLETIRCMVKLYPNTVDNIIIRLSSLLRYSINNTIKTISLGEDIKYTENYLQILKYRFNHRFDYEIIIEEDAKECIIPKLLVQPVIENAVKHGFENREHLTVKIKARIMENQLIIVIFDDGVGISKEKIKEVNAILSDNTNNSDCIGLYNVSRRIKLMYGKKYGLNIMSEEQVGTTVRICIPAD